MIRFRVTAFRTSGSRAHLIRALTAAIEPGPEFAVTHRVLGLGLLDADAQAGGRTE
jgi:hypothetical protein